MVLLEVEPRGLLVLGKCFITELGGVGVWLCFVLVVVGSYA